MAKKKSRRKSRITGCKSGTVRFKTRRGKVISFKGKQGPACGPRRKPSTAHLRPFKSMMRKASKSCAGKSLKPFRACVRVKMKQFAKHA